MWKEVVRGRTKSKKVQRRKAAERRWFTTGEPGRRGDRERGSGRGESRGKGIVKSWKEEEWRRRSMRWEGARSASTYFSQLKCDRKKNVS